MKTITINVANEEDLALACEEVARLINEGYTSGFIGVSSDTGSIDEE